MKVGFKIAVGPVKQIHFDSIYFNCQLRCAKRFHEKNSNGARRMISLCSLSSAKLVRGQQSCLIVSKPIPYAAQTES